MSCVAIGDKTVQNYLDMLSVDTAFGNLLAAQQLQYINFGEQECANISKKNEPGRNVGARCLPCSS